MRWAFFSPVHRPKSDSFTCPCEQRDIWSIICTESSCKQTGSVVGVVSPWSPAAGCQVWCPGGWSPAGGWSRWLKPSLRYRTAWPLLTECPSSSAGSSCRLATSSQVRPFEKWSFSTSTWLVHVGTLIYAKVHKHSTYCHFPVGLMLIKESTFRLNSGEGAGCENANIHAREFRAGLIAAIWSANLQAGTPWWGRGSSCPGSCRTSWPPRRRLPPRECPSLLGYEQPAGRG